MNSIISDERASPALTPFFYFISHRHPYVTCIHPRQDRTVSIGTVQLDRVPEHATGPRPTAFERVGPGFDDGTTDTRRSRPTPDR